MRCLVLSLMIALSCQLFYETIVPRKRRHPEWINNTATAAFTAGFLLISYAAVPPFVLRPVRIILITVLTAQFYFQIQFAKNLILSVLFCGIYWMISTMTLSVLSLFMNFTTESSRQILENLTEGMNLCLMMLFYHQCKHHIHGIDDIHWKSLGFLPFLFLFVVMAINMIPYNITAANNYARLAAISGFAVLSIFLFYFNCTTYTRSNSASHSFLHRNLYWYLYLPAKLHTRTYKLRSDGGSLRIYHPLNW